MLTSSTVTVSEILPLFVEPLFVVDSGAKFLVGDDPNFFLFGINLSRSFSLRSLRSSLRRASLSKLAVVL